MIGFSRAAHLLVEVTALTNKWLMWSEMRFPDQDIYLQTIFQLRDSQNHLTKMFAVGFTNNHLDENDDECFSSNFFHDKDVKFQICESLGHALRAFFDGADFILTMAKEDLVNRDDASERYEFYSRKIDVLIDAINELRSKKSDDYEQSYQNVLRWDNILQKVTRIYSISEKYDLANSFKRLQLLENKIEDEHSDETITKHCSDFYSRIKKEITELHQSLTWFDEVIINALDDKIDPNPAESQKQELQELEHIQSKINELTNELLMLNSAMMNTTKLKKRKNIKNSFFESIRSLSSLIIAAVLTFLFSPEVIKNEDGQFLIQFFEFNLEPQCAIFVFICLVMLIYVIIGGIHYLICRNKYK